MHVQLINGQKLVIKTRDRTIPMKQQLHLFKNSVDQTHGGSKSKGKRKVARPLSTKKPIHIVLKASDPFQLLRNVEVIEKTLTKYSQKFGVTVYQTAVQADHLHFSVTIPSRDLYRRWIRAITSVLALKIKKLKWSLPPFTRIATWGRDFKRLCGYIQRNRIEGTFLLNGHRRVDEYRESFFRCFETPRIA